MEIGEEFGWRGWLATRAAAWGFWPLALVGGVVWIVWHLPVLAVIGDCPPWDIVIYFAAVLPCGRRCCSRRWTGDPGDDAFVPFATTRV